ncbi:MAG: 7,8-dihydroneopterin aldolase/epimerase/oxygenase [Campylobacterota bacterium]|nr:7,8-dihydroneopterin aldolase/epimerase/oxygenase [Campylobacterota bacterium]MDQ1267575.1 7,8-dihydroneopterin aldolase/epimerase/oxygenase [Campylobacterota bacterium]MDQ1337319.1 7,8-dihydroneopterin aldolase/epimerase/oxygenase [Campylobacterota bacterium]
MKIHVEDLKLQCIIGILDFERVKPQDVIVNISIEYDYKKEFINYVKIVEIIKEMMIKSEFLLIEDAIKSINLKLIKEFNAIKSIDLKITKPSILPECKVSVSDYYKSQS